MQRACEQRTSRSGPIPQHHNWIELVFDYTAQLADLQARLFAAVTPRGRRVWLPRMCENAYLGVRRMWRWYIPEVEAGLTGSRDRDTV